MEATYALAGRAIQQAHLASDALLQGGRLQHRHAERALALEKRKGYSPRHVAGRQSSGSWMAFPAGSEKAIMGSTLLHLKEKGPTVPNTAVLYADVLKILTQATNILSDSLNPQQARNMAHSWLALASTFAMGQSVGASSRVEFVGNPNVVRLPPNIGNKRRRSSTEAKAGSS